MHSGSVSVYVNLVCNLNTPRSTDLRKAPYSGFRGLSSWKSLRLQYCMYVPTRCFGRFNIILQVGITYTLNTLASCFKSALSCFPPTHREVHLLFLPPSTHFPISSTLKSGYRCSLPSPSPQLSPHRCLTPQFFRLPRTLSSQLSWTPHRDLLCSTSQTQHRCRHHDD